MTTEKHKTFKDHLNSLTENPKFISGIHNYCDRWCERCSFTSRCMNFSLSEAQFDDPEARDMKNAKFWEKLSEIFQVILEMLKEDVKKWDIDLDSFDFDEIAKEEKLKEETAENHECCYASEVYWKMVNAWFESGKGLFEKREDELNKKLELELPNVNPKEEAISIKDAVEIIRWYQYQIFVKLKRAVTGISEEGNDAQNEYPKDSDGSAKVALIAIDRSISAWGKIRKHFPEEDDKVLDLLVHLDRLRRKTEKTFPNARAFVRPGFDEFQNVG